LLQNQNGKSAMVTRTMVASAFSLIWHWRWGHTQSNLTGMVTPTVKPASQPGRDKASWSLVSVEPVSFAPRDGLMVLITRLWQSRLLHARFRFRGPGYGVRSVIRRSCQHCSVCYKKIKVNDVLAIWKVKKSTTLYAHYAQWLAKDVQNATSWFATFTGPMISRTIRRIITIL
jgi:hypothetical protein